MQKTLFLILATALFIHIGIPKAQAGPNISVDFFYDQLGDYGDWVEVGDYGYGWQPRGVDEDWRPYSDGRWAYTDAGWTWLSEEPYGWAVYHYGRWARIEGKGWIWIPGTEWAPAWVSWRRSPQYVGWAPLPPEASFRQSVGFGEWVDSYYDIGPSAYRFVEVRNFGAPQLRSVFVDPRENITIIQQTTNITQITHVDGVVNNGGPRYEDISRESAEPIRRLKLDRRVEVEGDRNSLRGEQMRPRVEGDTLRLFAPGFDARSATPPTKLSPKIENVVVNHGWKDAGPAADVEKLHAKVRSEAKPPQGLPPQPKFERLAAQPTAPDAQPAPEKPVLGAPSEKARGEKAKDSRIGQESPVAPVAPSTESKVVKPETALPPAAGPADPERKGKNRKQPELPPPTPVEPVEPKTKQDRPAARGELPPAPEPPESKNVRSFPPEPTPHREAPEPPKIEPRQPKPERPESAREVPPAIERSKPPTERPNPPNVAPGNALQSAPRGEAEKPKPGKGKAKDDKKPDGATPKPQ